MRRWCPRLRRPVYRNHAERDIFRSV
jgi:hypothetical protein